MVENDGGIHGGRVERWKTYILIECHWAAELTKSRTCLPPDFLFIFKPILVGFSDFSFWKYVKSYNLCLFQIWTFFQ